MGCCIARHSKLGSNVEEDLKNTRGSGQVAIFTLMILRKM